MARRKLIAGNWKMNKLQGDGTDLADELAEKMKAAGQARYDMVVCPPFNLLASVIGAVVGEWVGSSEGLGYVALRSKSQFLTERVYAAIFLLGAMGVGLFLAAGLAQRVLVPWHGRQRGGPNT